MSRRSYTKGFVTVYAAKLGEKFIYVGCTQKKLSSRVADHFYEATVRNSNLIFHKWLRKNKSKVSFEEIFYAKNRDEGLAAEMAFIKQFKTLEKHGGLNATEGGLGCRRPHGAETRRKISNANREFYKTHAGFNAGRIFGEAARKNMSLGASKRRKQVLRVDTGDIYESLAEAAKKNGFKKSSLAKACSGVRPALHGIRFKYCKTNGVNTNAGG